VVRPLGYQRHTIAVSLLWRPLPEGWEHIHASPSSDRLALPEHLLQHRALLQLPDGTPISEVVENYTREVMAFRVVN